MQCKAIVAIALLAFSSLTYAVDQPGWVGSTTIEFITVQPNDNVYVRVSSGVPDLGCPGNSQGYLQFDVDAPNYKEQYSLLLTAHMAGKEVTIYVEHCGYYPYAQNTRLPRQ